VQKQRENQRIQPTAAWPGSSSSCGRVCLRLADAYIENSLSPPPLVCYAFSHRSAAAARLETGNMLAGLRICALLPRAAAARLSAEQGTAVDRERERITTKVPIPKRARLL
jgi:hypothetical protein